MRKPPTEAPPPTSADEPTGREISTRARLSLTSARRRAQRRYFVDTFDSLAAAVGHDAQARADVYERPGLARIAAHVMDSTSQGLDLGEENVHDVAFDALDAAYTSARAAGASPEQAWSTAADAADAAAGEEYDLLIRRVIRRAAATGRLLRMTEAHVAARAVALPRPLPRATRGRPRTRERAGSRRRASGRRCAAASRSADDGPPARPPALAGLAIGGAR